MERPFCTMRFTVPLQPRGCGGESTGVEVFCLVELWDAEGGAPP